MPIMFRPLLISLCLTSTALATTWTVDDDSKADFDNIQAAIDAASDGDEIIVMPGIYTGTGNEVVRIWGEKIWLHSKSGPEKTIIDAEMARHCMTITYADTNETIVEGFTLINGNSQGNYSWGGGIKCTSSDPVLINLIFNNNHAVEGGGGLGCTGGGSAVIMNCTFKNNTANQQGGGIGFETQFATVISSKICENYAPQNAQISGTWIDGGNNFVAESCVDDDGDNIPDGVDNCELYNPDQADCNNNGIGDICDIADSTSPDCDQNSVPDECQPDCDGDGWIDPCDNEADVDGDGIPDNCQEDCNGNTLPDHWEIEMGWVDDCNDNGIPDECECVGDANQEGNVNTDDILIIIGYWGNNTSFADLNCDGIVDVSDLLIVIDNWGPCE